MRREYGSQNTRKHQSFKDKQRLKRNKLSVKLMLMHNKVLHLNDYFKSETDFRLELCTNIASRNEDEQIMSESGAYN